MPKSPHEWRGWTLTTRQTHGKDVDCGTIMSCRIEEDVIIFTTESGPFLFFDSENPLPDGNYLFCRIGAQGVLKPPREV